MRILAIEDHPRLAAALNRGLEAEGFAVDVALNGEDGLWMARECAYDAIICDILLPKINGYRVCAALREEGNWTPILMRRAGQVVSKAEILDHVWDFDFDGDDNVVEVYVRYLRRKVDIPFGRESIETVRGAGYRLADAGD